MFINANALKSVDAIKSAINIWIPRYSLFLFSLDHVPSMNNVWLTNINITGVIGSMYRRNLTSKYPVKIK